MSILLNALKHVCNPWDISKWPFQTSTFYIFVRFSYSELSERIPKFFKNHHNLSEYYIAQFISNFTCIIILSSYYLPTRESQPLNKHQAFLNLSSVFYTHCYLLLILSHCLFKCTMKTKHSPLEYTSFRKRRVWKYTEYITLVNFLGYYGFTEFAW